MLRNARAGAGSPRIVRLVNTFSAAFGEAFRLVAAFDPKLAEIVWLSLRVSLSAVAISTLVALPVGAALAVARFPGRDALVVVVNALLGLPAVVVGLAVYLLLSRAGPLGAFGILFTPAAMVVAQAVLIFPLIAALARQAVADAWREYAEQFHSLGAGPVASSLALLHDLRFSLVTIVLAAFGRAIAEVGAVMIVGGNIDGVTRVMTTAIALETSKGDLPLALGLGIVLLSIVLVLNVAAHLLKERAQRGHA
jgi:tungstate transport system permease protein